MLENDEGASSVKTATLSSVPFLQDFCLVELMHKHCGDHNNNFPV